MGLGKLALERGTYLDIWRDPRSLRPLETEQIFDQKNPLGKLLCQTSRGSASDLLESAQTKNMKGLRKIALVVSEMGPLTAAAAFMSPVAAKISACGPHVQSITPSLLNQVDPTQQSTGRLQARTKALATGMCQHKL